MYCECGCGQTTNLSSRNRTSSGQVKGKFRRFVTGHNGQKRSGEHSAAWRGGRFIDGQGYVRLHAPGHVHADSRGYVHEHVAVASAALGKALPLQAQIHHVNEIHADNANTNLVICPDNTYHRLLHIRLTALKACGNPNYRKCWICKQYDDLSNLSGSQSYGKYHKKCRNARNIRLRREKHEAASF